MSHLKGKIRALNRKLVMAESRERIPLLIWRDCMGMCREEIDADIAAARKRGVRVRDFTQGGANE